MRGLSAVIVIFFGVLLGFLLINGLQSYHRQLDAHDRYRPVDAVIVVSQLLKPITPNGRPAAQIKYNYTVDDQSYQGSRYAYVSEAENAAVRLERYPVGKNVTAWYDPGNPAEAILNKDETSMPQILSWFIPTPVIAFVVWFFYRRASRRLAAVNRNGAA